jgi:hypothetical protein
MSMPKQDGKCSDAKNDAKKSNRKPWENGGGKRFQPRQQNEPKAVPMLIYGRDNFHAFREAMSTECLTKFGNVGKLVELRKYFVMKQSMRNNFASFTNPDDQKFIYLEALKRWATAQNDMEMKHPM